jgi:outer membrane protein TolC
MRLPFYAAVFLAVFTAGPVSALTIDEAVDLALANNHRIKEARHLEQSAVSGIGVSRSNFHPSFDVSYDYRRSEQEISNFGDEASTFTLELSYNLFRGKEDVHGLAESRARSDAAAWKRRSVEADIALAVKWAFIDVLRARRSVDTEAEGVQLLEAQRQEAERFFQQGLTAKNDLLRVEVELSSARQALLRAEGNLHLAWKGLVRLLGVDLPGGEEIAPFTKLPEPGDLSFPALREEMLQNRSEIAYLKSLQTALEKDRESLKAPYWPRVDFVLAHDSFGDTIFPGGQEGGFDSDTSARLAATWNLYNGKRTKHEVEEAEYRALANAEALEDTVAELVLQLESALERYRVARANTDTARVAVEQAEENYRVNENLYKARLGTSTDLTDARFFLTRSRSEYTDALAETFKAVTGLERVLERPRPERPSASPGPERGTPFGERSSPRTP